MFLRKTDSSTGIRDWGIYSMWMLNKISLSWTCNTAWFSVGRSRPLHSVSYFTQVIRFVSLSGESGVHFLFLVMFWQSHFLFLWCFNNLMTLPSLTKILSTAAMKIPFLSFQLSSVNLTNLLELSRELTGEAANFTNKELFLDYLNRFFKTGARLLSPISQSNDMVALNFSQVRRSYYSINLGMHDLKQCRHDLWIMELKVTRLSGS